MAYADYLFYSTVYRGAMSEADFIIWASRATDKMDMLTQGKAATTTQTMAKRIKLCCCALADTLLAENNTAINTQNGAVASENNDGYSISYKAIRSKTADICAEYLSYPDNLMYRGL
ncbi:MAG: hypothetical protein RR612_06230 [Oscillospiraceae bacterium]